MQPFEELFDRAAKLERTAKDSKKDEIAGPLEALEDAAKKVGRSFSGSWWGYHSRVYYSDFEVPPPGAHFSQEWGLMDTSYTSLGSRGKWIEYEADAVKEHVKSLAGNPNLDAARDAWTRASAEFETAKAEIVSILQTELDGISDEFLMSLKEQIEDLEPLSQHEVAERVSPQGQTMTRDTVVLGQGKQVPPHMVILTEIRAIQHAFGICQAGSNVARKAASHLERKGRRRSAERRIGTNVFIGHGGSSAWRELKDFVEGRLRLPWDEFNRVPVAGVTNVARLSEMLDAAAVALLVMTSEDELADGSHQARLNVVHEAGLFQGRLGFGKAVLLLEEGCSQFSNIEGLGQIRFPKGNIAAVFEEIRRVMEREGLIEK